MAKDQEITAIGYFGRPFGIAGFIRIFSSIPLPNNLFELNPFFFRKEKHSPWNPLPIMEFKYHGKETMIKMANHSAREDLSLFTNHELGILRSKLPKLNIGEYYWSELIGLVVINTVGEKLGTVAKLMATGANDVLVLTDGNHKHLLPYISSVILKIDGEQKTILVDWETDYFQTP